jgi:WD40 repeat protein
MAQRSESGTQDRRAAPGADLAVWPTVPGATAPAIGDDRTLAAPAAAPTARLLALAAGLPRVAREAYAVGDEVAKGGIGKVVRARDERLDRPVAIKELLVWDEAQERRFVREALLTARLQHPAIVPVYEAGRWPDGEPFYAMKLVSGRSLAELIGERPALAERLALLPHVLAAAQAVAYAHSQQIIHRDLKPANVLVGEFGETVVIDWGLAKHLAEDEPAAEPAARAGAGLTQQGAVMGTPSYMPPEQAAGAAVDERTDVYALGAMLYHLLAAAAPYDEVAWDRLLPAIAAGPPRRLEALVPRLDDELAAVVHKAMARDPADRYRTARELADDLGRYQSGQIVAAHTYSTWQLLRRHWRRNRATLSVAAAALALVALVVLAAFLKTDRQRQFAEHKEREAVEAWRAEGRARRAAEELRAQATARADEMTLLQAHDALGLDPNRALAWLKTLSPEYADAARVRRIAADAQTRGTSRAFDGHTGYINRVVVSPDGTRFVTASDDKTVRVWDERTGASRLLVGHTDEVWHARFVSDDEVASVGKDRTLRRWDARSGAPLQALPVPGATRQLVPRADGAILGAHADGAAWILRPGADAVELLTPTAPRPRWAVLSGDGRRLVVHPHGDDAHVRDVDGPARRVLPRTRDDTSRWFLDRRGAFALQQTATTTTLWDLSSGTARELGGPSYLHRPAFSPAGDLAAFAVDDALHVHATRDGALVRRFTGHVGAVQSVMFSDDGRRLVTGGVDRTIRAWDLDVEAVEVRAGLAEVPTDATWLADGRSIVATSTSGEVRVFDPRRAGEILVDHGGPASGLAVAADGRVASLDDRGGLRVTDLEGRAVASHAGPPAPLARLVAAPDGRGLAGVALAWSAVVDGRHPDPKAPPATLLLGEFDQAAPRRVALPAAALDLAWAPDGAAVLVALADGTLQRVDRDGHAAALGRLPAAATSVAAEPGGAWIAVGGEDGALRLIDAASGARRELAPHTARVTALALAGDLLASGCADHTVRLWRADGSFRAYDEGGHGVEQMAFSADGRALIFLSGGETKLRRIDVASGEHLDPLAGHGGPLVGFTLAPDGRRLLTHGADGAAHLVDLADGRGRTLAGHVRPVAGAGFAAGGRTIVTLGREGTVRAWPDDLPETMAGLRAWIDAATPDRIPGR